MFQRSSQRHDVNEVPVSRHHPHEPGRTRRHVWILLAAGALAACGEDAEPVTQAEDPAEAPAAMTTAVTDWRRLADGSVVRTATGLAGDRADTDRCWPTDGGFDCLSLDAIAYPPGAIVVASRTAPRAYTDVPVAPPEVGFSCAIYPGGVIEQRLLRGDAERLQNDDTDGSLWSAADVARLSAVAGGQRAPFVDCTALAARLAGNSASVLAETSFERREVMPPA